MTKPPAALTAVTPLAPSSPVPVSTIPMTGAEVRAADSNNRSADGRTKWTALSCPSSIRNPGLINMCAAGGAIYTKPAASTSRSLACFTCNVVERPRISAIMLTRFGSMCCTTASGIGKSAGRPPSIVASADKPPADAATASMVKAAGAMVSAPDGGTRYSCYTLPHRGLASRRLHGLCISHVMAHYDVVVVGASSGGVDALVRLLSPIPSHFGAAIFVVLHVRPDQPSHLPAILNRAGALPVAHAVDGEPIRRGRVYVAPPGVQTYLQRGRIGVRRGPQENL